LNKERDQLDVTCFFISLFNARHVSDVNTSILRCLRHICWVISWVVLLWVDVCVLVLRCCLAGVVWHPDNTPPQPNHNLTPTHIEPEQYNSWNNSTNKSQAPEVVCINIRNMLSIKWNKKSKRHQVGLSLFNYQDDERSNKHKILVYDGRETVRSLYSSLQGQRFLWWV